MKIIFSLAVFVMITSNSFAQTQKRLEEPLRTGINGIQNPKSLEEVLRNSMIFDAPGIPLTEVKNHIGSEVHVYDTIKGYKVINDTLRLLFIGENHPKHILTILVNGSKINRETIFEVGGKWHFSGRAILYKDKPAITITNPYQLSRRIIF